MVLHPFFIWFLHECLLQTWDDRLVRVASFLPEALSVCWCVTPAGDKVTRQTSWNAGHHKGACVCLRRWMCVWILCLTDGWWVEFPSHHYLSFQCASRELRTSSREEGQVGDLGWAAFSGCTWRDSCLSKSPLKSSFRWGKAVSQTVRKLKTKWVKGLYQRKRQEYWKLNVGLNILKNLKKP